MLKFRHGLRWVYSFCSFFLPFKPPDRVLCEPGPVAEIVPIEDRAHVGETVSGNPCNLLRRGSSKRESRNGRSAEIMEGEVVYASALAKLRP